MCHCFQSLQPLINQDLMAPEEYDCHKGKWNGNDGRELVTLVTDSVLTQVHVCIPTYLFFGEGGLGKYSGLVYGSCMFSSYIRSVL